MSSCYDLTAPIQSSTVSGESLPPWGIHRHAAVDEEWRRQHARRRARTPSAPSYSEALCAASKRIRQRSVPPPPPPPYHEPSWPRKVFRHPGKPPIPPWENQYKKPNSDYYRNYIKSIYEREPLFDPYIRSLPAEDVNLYKRDTVAKIKSDFHHMIGDKWTRKGFQDPSVEHDLAGKLYPWRDYVARGGETASERLRREHAAAGYYCPLQVPKVRVYHPSTWQQQR